MEKAENGAWVRCTLFEFFWRVNPLELTLFLSDFLLLT